MPVQSSENLASTPAGGDYTPAAVLFDMDGTLTQPLLDFSAIRAEIGMDDEPILEAMAAMSPEERAAAEAIVHRHEDHAAENSTLNPGCEDLLHYLQSRDVPIAVITRNSRRCAEIVFDRHGLEIDVLVTRDDGKFKPDPSPLHLACGRLGVPSQRSWMVGDGEFDIVAGQAAGAATVWLSHDRERGFPAQPWRTVRDLFELHNLLRDYVS